MTVAAALKIAETEPVAKRPKALAPVLYLLGPKLDVLKTYKAAVVVPSLSTLYRNNMNRLIGGFSLGITEFA